MSGGFQDELDDYEKDQYSDKVSSRGYEYLMNKNSEQFLKSCEELTKQYHKNLETILRFFRFPFS